MNEERGRNGSDAAAADEENGEVYESRLSRLRIGCLYFVVGWILLSVVAFFLMLLWDRFAGGQADGEIPSIPMVF